MNSSTTIPTLCEKDYVFKIMGIPDFAEKTIRITPDGKRISAIDLVSLATDQDNSVISARTFRDICENHSEVRCITSHLKFPGRGQRDTPTLDGRDVSVSNER